MSEQPESTAPADDDGALEDAAAEDEAKNETSDGEEG